MTVSSTRASAADLERVRYEMAGPGVARITLARPDKRNAQDYQLLYELDAAFGVAAADDDVRVIILAADGMHFSSGHDLVSRVPVTAFPTVNLTGGFDQPGQHGGMAVEEEVYLGLCWRWRNIPKPTIAQVHGKVIAGGLMLVWPMDLVIASEDATFADPVVAFGCNGHEYFTHVWELGARKAREMLFRGNAMSARECASLGMVNHVVPRADLEAFTLTMAEEIAQRPPMGLRLAKMAVNQSLDAQGQWTALQAAFGLHQLAHAHSRAVFDGVPVDPSGIDVIRNLSRD
jgi:enoyl-CoA hydratase